MPALSCVAQEAPLCMGGEAEEETVSTPEERFWSKVERRGPEECWLWTALANHDGYGLFFVNGRRLRAHRYAYELLVGPIPLGLTIDHLCRVRGCANPAHMEPVTNRVNTLRGVGPTALNATMIRCREGHELHAGRRTRRCLVCKREAARTRAAHPRADDEPTRVCKTCGLLRPIAEFYRREGIRVHQCRACHTKADRPRQQRRAKRGKGAKP